MFPTNRTSKITLVIGILYCYFQSMIRECDFAGGYVGNGHGQFIRVCRGDLGGRDSYRTCTIGEGNGIVKQLLH